MKKRPAPKFVLVLLIIFLSVSGLEIVTRVALNLKRVDVQMLRPSRFYHSDTSHIETNAANDKTRFASHPFLPYTSIPNQYKDIFMFRPTINKSVEYKIQNNSFGFRTPEVPFAKKEKTYRIIILGGSNTFDGPDNEHTWPAILEKKLNEYYKDRGHSVECINLAIDMGMSAQSLINLQLIGVMYEPDLILSADGAGDYYGITTFNLKDVMPDYRNRMKKFDDKGGTGVQSKLPTWVFYSYFISGLTKFMDEKIVGAGVHEQIYKNSDEGNANNTVKSNLVLFHRNIKLMRGVANEYKSDFCAAIPHWLHLDPNLNSFDDSTRVFFKHEKINFLDLEAAIPHDDLTYHVDDVHWTLKGLDSVADEWFKKITAENLLH